MEKIYSLILPENRSVKNKTYSFLIISFILVLAAFLRLYRISDYMTFLGDEGRDVLVVYNILHGHLTLLGPTASVGGFFLGPIYYYFMAPFLFLSDYNPVGPAIMVALFGVATVWLVYKIGSEFLDEYVGMVCALLYSISPVVIAYSRSSWNPNIMPFFSLLTIYFIFLATEKNKFKYFFLTGIFLGVAMQLHYLTIFLFAIIIIYTFLARVLYLENGYKQIIQRIIDDFFYILIGFIIGSSTFLAFEVRHGFPNIRSIFRFILFSHETGVSGNFFTIIKDVFFRLFGRLIGNFPPPEQITLQNNFRLLLWYYFILLTALFSSVLLLSEFFKSLVLKDKNGKKYLLLSIWLIAGITLFGFYKKSIYDYYFGFMFPLPFLILGNFLVLMWKKRNIVFKIFAFLSFAFFIFINLNSIPFRYIPNKQLDQVKQISRFVFDAAGGDQPFNFALITGGNSDHAYRYFFTLWGNPPVTIQNFDVDPKRKSVTDNLFVVCETVPCHPLGFSLWEIAGFGRATISGEWSVSVVKIYKLIHYKGS